MIEDLVNAQSNPTIATYAKTGEVHLRVTAKAEDEKEAKKLLKPIVKELKSRFGNHIYTTQHSRYRIIYQKIKKRRNLYRLCASAYRITPFKTNLSYMSESIVAHFTEVR